MTRLKDRVTLGFPIPQFGSEPVQTETVDEIIRRTEELGFDGIWTQESLLSQDAAYDGLELLCFAAGITSAVDLGIATVVLPRHQPAVLAKRLTTLDHLSGGRLLVGVSLGAGNEYFAGAGLPPDRPVRRFREGIEALNAFWESTRPSYRGEIWQIENVSMSPQPWQRPRPPLWVGGGHPNALRRAAEYGDGWIGAGSSTIAEFQLQARSIRRRLEEIGRDPDTFSYSKRVYLAIDDDVGRAERLLGARLAGIYGAHAPATDVAVCGPPDHVLGRLWELADGGATHLLLNPLYQEREQLEILAEMTGAASR